MRAVVVREYGPPESFRIEDLPTPEPGPGQARIAIQAAGLSFVDALIAAGKYQVKPPPPFSPGTEFAGVIEALGPDVAGLSVGDRVIGGSLVGGLQQAIVVPVRSLTRAPDGMDIGEAAVFRMGYSTAYHALVQRARLEPGETVLVLGAAGAVGSASVNLAKALGARVIASASTPAKRELALAMGAEAAVDSRAEDWRDQIKALTGGKGVDVVVDPVGGAAMEPAFRSLAWNGRHLVIGFAAGEIARLAANLPLLKGGALVGVDVRQFGEREPDLAADNMKRLFALYAERRIRPHIGLRLPLDRFAEALVKAGDGSAAGRVVVEPWA